MRSAFVYTPEYIHLTVGYEKEKARMIENHPIGGA
jgi:hypothetical protein